MIDLMNNVTEVAERKQIAALQGDLPPDQASACSTFWGVIAEGLRAIRDSVEKAEKQEALDATEAEADRGGS